MPKILSSAAKQQKLWGLIDYKPRWSLTCRGWLFIITIIALILSFALTHLHPFLCISAPLAEAEVLVVEGWLNDEALKGAKAEFDRGNYRLLATTGDSLSKGSFLSSYKTFAELSAATLVAMGIDRDKVEAISCKKVATYRTNACAQAVKEFLTNATVKVRSINLYSYDTHARRSWLIFKQVLDPTVRVGIISAPSPDYQPGSWWASSEGSRSVVSEALAYLFMRLTGKL